MKIRDTTTGKAFDLPKHVATGLARSKSNAYELVTDEPADTTQQTGTGGDTVPTSSATVAQLKAYAQENDIDLGGASRKADIWAAVSAALTPGESQADDGGTDDGETGNDQSTDHSDTDTGDTDDSDDGDQTAAADD